jgi:hypothetical protein
MEPYVFKLHLPSAGPEPNRVQDKQAGMTEFGFNQDWLFERFLRSEREDLNYIL